jgi:phenylacetate-CoA ligase
MNLYSKSIYVNSPIPLQNAQISIKGLASRLARRTPSFQAYCAAAMERECWPVDRIREFQQTELICFVQHALRTVPFYQQMCRERGIAPSEIRRQEDLTLLPILEKDAVRQLPQRFVPSDLNPSHLVRGYTSGTSGSPIMLMRSLDSIRREHSFVWRQFRWAGCRLMDRIAVLRGDMIVPAGQRKPPY